MSYGFLPSPFPVRSSRLYVYAAASELLGQQIPKEARIKLWEQIPQEQALSLIAQIQTDIEISATRDGISKSDVDKRWTASVCNNHLRTRLTIASTLGVTLFAPQLLLLAADEVLSHCPEGPPNDTLDGLDDLILCLLGIGDDTLAGEGSETWGGMEAALAGEIIANLHFNRTMWLAHQLSWFDRVWFQAWPKKTSETVTVGGEPSELFKEATGIELADFGAVAFNVYAQSANHQLVRFPQAFFETLGIESSAVGHFLRTTSRTIPEIREEIQASAAAAGSSRYGFDAFRRFPLLRLSSGELLVLSPNFVIQRALSEVTFWDVRNYLKVVDRKREEAFHRCTTAVLEHETGVALRRIFSRSKIQVLDEAQLQKKFGSKKEMPRLCDFAIRSGHTWLLVEVTDRPMPRPVVLATARAADLDAELDKVLTERKAKQLASTLNLLQSEFEQGADNARPYTFIALVVTGQTALPWNPAVHQRAKERLASLTDLPEDFRSSVALITLKDFMMLENAASLGHDILELLQSWRQADPGSPLDQYLHEQKVPLSSPLWEKNQATRTINKFKRRMSGNKPQ